jgi:hypothetical protein
VPDLEFARSQSGAESHVAWFHQRATQQLVAGERGIAPFSTSLVRRGLNAARPRHLNSNVSWLLVFRIERSMSVHRIVLILLLLLTGSSAACSFRTYFVVVNASDKPVTVTYTIGSSDVDPLAATGVRIPAMLSASELSTGEWRLLSSTQFTLDRSSRTVTVSLPPNQGLLIALGGEWSPNSTAAINFIIKEIHISGPNSEMMLKGDQVYKSFVVVPKPFYGFGPPTLFTLTFK